MIKKRKYDAVDIEKFGSEYQFFKELLYLLKKHKFLSVEEQKAILSDYALKNQLLSLEFRTTKIEKDLSLGKLSENDIITMADIFLLGLNFQDIMQMLDLICSKGIELHIVSENLFFNIALSTLPHVPSVLP